MHFEKFIKLYVAFILDRDQSELVGSSH